MKTIRSFILFALAMSSWLVFPQDGQRDNSFGGDGEVTTDVFGFFDFAFDVTQQSDGKILAAGGSENEVDNWVPTLVRYLADGSIDNSFGIDGIVFTDFNTPFGTDRFHNVIALEDQKVLAGGSFGNSVSRNIMLIRYLPNGDLDPSFGIDGITVTDLGDDDRFIEMAILNDGKILVAGISKVGGFKLTFSRYLPNGTLDPSFGDNGILVTNKGTASDAYLTLKVLEDNKIIVSGLLSGGIRLIKFEEDGSLDLAFGNDGAVITTSEASYISAFDITADGKIIVGLNRNLGNDESEGYLKRFLTDGTLDTSFGSDGEATINYENLRPTRIIIQPNQRILILGSASYGVDSIDCVVLRYRMNGALDTTFAGGEATTSETPPSDFLLQEDGKIVWIGTTLFDLNFTLVRYHNDPFTFGIEDQILNGLAVYPNPSSGNFILQYDNFQSLDTEYQLTDITGKLVQKGMLSGYQTTIDLSTAQSGMYFLKAGNTTLRLIKE